MDNQVIWVLGALFAVGGGYGACALSTSDDASEELAVRQGGPDLSTMPEMPSMHDADTLPPPSSTSVVEPEQPTMPQYPGTTGVGCNGGCATGQLCCPTTNECVPADCAACCAPELARKPVIPVELAPRGDGPAGPMPAPDAIEGGGGVRPPGPDPRVGQ